MQNIPHTLEGFLTKYKTKDGEKITHTRIGDVSLAIYGGSYSIPENMMGAFNKLYLKTVINGGSPSYLTEVQLETGGAILIDLDERYETDVTERQHKYGHIEDLIGLYVEKILEIIEPIGEFTIPCYIMEKDNINSTNDSYVKDGIHIIFGLGMCHNGQLLLRNKVLEDIGDIFEDLPLSNTYEQLVDVGIPRGKTNWQLFGSKKPGNEAYKLTKAIKVEIGETGDIGYSELKIGTIDVDTLANISARNNNNLKVSLNEEYAEQANQLNKKIKIGKKSNITFGKSKIDSLLDCIRAFPEINSKDRCDFIIKKILEYVEQQDDYKIKQAYMLTEILDERYYGPGTFDNWLKVAWTLKSISELLYPAWLSMSSNSETFTWESNDCFEKWNGRWDPEKSPTIGSLKFWAKECNQDKYEIIKRENIDYYIDRTLDGESQGGAAEYDVALLVNNIYEDRFKCCNIRSKTWFEYKLGRWENIDSGTTLRQALSQSISNIYHNKVKETLDTLNDSVEEDKEKCLRKRAQNMCQIALKLKKTTWKQNIMRECSEVFFDQHFLNKLDTKTHLLCFQNGVLDMKEKVFRKGRPDDYLSLCTNTIYEPYDPEDEEQVKIRGEINIFMKQLFPIPNVEQYMWEHLASILNGTNKNQTFNVYLGSGRNGKSKLVTLMSMVLGDYKGSVPLTVITQKRSSIGNVSPEIALLKGLRYGVMQEPSKKTKLNEGPFKELVGEDPIQGRCLFQDTVTFVPQFKLAVCTNHLFEVNSNDDGTWRRFRIVDFPSKFVDNPSTNPDDYEFQIDRDMDNKFKKWVPVFTAMLAAIVFKTDGLVNDCPEVMASSQKYKESQDYFAGFMKERIVSHPTGMVKRSDAYSEFQEWYSELYGGKVPSGKELFEYMETKLGRPGKLGWKGFTLYHSYDLVDDDIQPNDLE